MALSILLFDNLLTKFPVTNFNISILYNVYIEFASIILYINLYGNTLVLTVEAKNLKPCFNLYY